MSKKSPLKTTRLAQRKRRMRLLKISAVIVVIALFIAGIVWVSRRPSLLITDISVTGNSSIDSNNVKEIVQKEIDGNYFKLFPRSNKFLYPKNSIHENLLDAFPRMQSVTIHIENGHVLNVSIAERTPAYTWCTGTPESTDTNADRQCYFMDNQGYVFSDAPIFSGHAYFAFYGLISDAPIGAHYLNADTFNVINTLIKILSGNTIHAYAFLADSDGVFNLYIGKGTRLVFKNDQDISTLILNLQALLRQTSVFAPHATTSVNYIDMRFGNKVYYK